MFEVKLVCKRLLTLTSGSGKLVKVVCGLGLWLVLGVLRKLVCWWGLSVC